MEAPRKVVQQAADTNGIGYDLDSKIHGRTMLFPDHYNSNFIMTRKMWSVWGLLRRIF